MTKSKYLSQFSKAVKWRLSYQEAEEIVKDYEELFYESGKKEEEFCHDLGSPQIAAQFLVHKGAYRRWLCVFGIQAFPMLLAFLLILFKTPFFSAFLPTIDLRPYPLLAAALLSGLISFIWFRPKKGQKEAKLPKSLLFTLGGQIFFTGFLMLFSLSFFRRLYDTGVSESLVSLVHFIVLSLIGYSVFSVILGIFALIKSRVCDRRWRAVYLFALTFLLLSLFFLQLLVSMDFSLEDRASFFYFLSKEIRAYIILGSIGILSSGVSLC